MTTNSVGNDPFHVIYLKLEKPKQILVDIFSVVIGILTFSLGYQAAFRWATTKLSPENLNQEVAKAHAFVLKEFAIQTLSKEMGMQDSEFREKELAIHSYHLDKIPEAIGDLRQLEKLTLSDRRIRELPKSIGNLEELRELDISNTVIITLPESFSRLTKLEKLSLSPIQHVDLRSFKNLKELKWRAANSLPELQGLSLAILSLPRCTSISDEIGHLTDLQELDLEFAEIDTLPDSIGNLRSLKKLSLVGCRIKKLPESIGDLGRLEILDLNVSQVDSLPDSIGKLVNLKSLKLPHSIKQLPSTFKLLTHLEELEIDFETLKASSDQIVNLKKIKKLSFWISEETYSKWEKEFPEFLYQLSETCTIEVTVLRSLNSHYEDSWMPPRQGPKFIFKFEGGWGIFPGQMGHKNSGSWSS